MHFFNRRPTQTNADILVRQTLPNKNLTALQAVVKLSNNHFPGVLIALIRYDKSQNSNILSCLSGREGNRNASAICTDFWEALILALTTESHIHSTPSGLAKLLKSQKPFSLSSISTLLTLLSPLTHSTTQAKCSYRMHPI